MPTVRQLLEEAAATLRAAGVETPFLDAEVMMSRVLGCSRVAVIAHSEIEPPPESSEQFHVWTDRRARREPLSYILGDREFYSLTFEVNPSVLIPRQETEFLVEAAITCTTDRTSPVVADIGLGSGCVAIAIVCSVPTAVAYGTDTSADALAVACRNAGHCGVMDRVRFMEGDLFEPLAGMEFDVIVSNPPYIPSGDIDGLQPEVVEYEPRQALDGGPDGLDVVRRLVSEAGGVLKHGGMLAMEIGQGQASAVECLLRSNGYREVRLMRDYSGIERVVVGEWR